MQAATASNKTDCRSPSVKGSAFAVVASVVPAGGSCIQSARMSGKFPKSGFRSLATVLAQLSTSLDSLIPSRIADLISQYMTHSPIAVDITHTPITNKPALASSNSSCVICISSPVPRFWPFMVSDSAAPGTSSASAAAGRAEGAPIQTIPVGNHGETFSGAIKRG